MNEEIKDLENILLKWVPFDYASFGSECTDRSRSKYSLNDFDFNLNNRVLRQDTAIIVTSYFGQLMWLKSTLSSYRKTDAFVILSYDNATCIWENIDDSEYILRMLPRPIHQLLAHASVVKHKTFDANKRVGWFWDVKYAQHIIRGFKNIKYVYVTNGDCILDRPEGMKEMPDILGDGDLMSGQSTPNGTIHTADMFFKADAFHKAVDYMSDRMKHYVLASESPECLMRDAVDELQLKETFIDYPILEDGSIDYYCTNNLDSTYKRVLGFRNLYAEQEYRENNRLEPIEKEYMDDFHNWTYCPTAWQETICQYYATGDRRYLYMWWDRGCDTDTERRYHPVEYYGNEPILVSLDAERIQ